MKIFFYLYFFFQKTKIDYSHLLKPINDEDDDDDEEEDDDDDDEEDDDDNALAAKLESLTPQQFRVLMMLADGLLNKQIAYELNVSEATVKAHMTAIMRKLGIFSRTQAALIAQQLDVDDAALGGPESD